MTDLLTIQQNVLKESVLSLPTSVDSSAPRPPISDLNDRYGSLFASIIEAQWDQGGRDVHHAVAGIQQQLEQEDAEAEAEAEDDAEGDEDEEDEEEGGAMEE